MTQTIAIYNYTTAAWEVLDSRPALTADVVIDVQVPKSPLHYLHPTSEKALVAVRFYDTGVVETPDWVASIDKVSFNLVTD